MKRLSYTLAGLMLTAAPAFAQNLTLPVGSEAFQASGTRADVAAPVAQPYALEQGRSVSEDHQMLRYRRQHR